MISFQGHFLYKSLYFIHLKTWLSLVEPTCSFLSYLETLDIGPFSSLRVLFFMLYRVLFFYFIHVHLIFPNLMRTSIPVNGFHYDSFLFLSKLLKVMNLKPNIGVRWSKRIAPSKNNDSTISKKCLRIQLNNW